MSFTSYTFLIFFVLVYAAYVMLRRQYRAQNLLLLIASYVFYGWWDWRFLSLLAGSTFVDYLIGRWLGREDDPAKRKRIVSISIITNLSFLGFFKYFNFFADSAAAMLDALGLHADPFTLSIVLPVGISFYTFQSLSYTIDVYRRELEPAKNLRDFALFVSFFPQLVAGPIERATALLPMVQGPRTIRCEQVNAGLCLILWGYWKKLVVADNCAMIANEVFNNYPQYHGMTLVVGAVAFAFQIFCDFSAYSDIGRGAAKLMGFDLMVNFRIPYFATTPSDFWSRWHISLSTWLRDYLYIPLGGNRGSTLFTMRNLMITMLLGGLWHGARWNFVLWGAFHGVILVIYRALNRRRKEPRNAIRGIGGWSVLLMQMAIMFALTLIGWILFRSENVEQIAYFFTRLGPSITHDTLTMGYDLAFFIAPLLLIQVWQQWKQDLLVMTRMNPILQALFYAWLFAWILIFGVREPVEFIYFQF